MDRKTLRGLFGIAGIWLSAGLALPFVNVLKQFSPEQLMFVRALITAALAAALLKGKVGRPSAPLLLAGLGFAGGCLGLYHSIRELGASLALVLVSATPLINFAGVWLRGKRVSGSAAGSLMTMIAGIVFALQPWGAGSKLSHSGLWWSLFAFVSAGLYFEALAKTEGTKIQKAFWQMATVALVGLSLMLAARSLPVLLDVHTGLLLLGFALLGGFVYVLSYVQAFEALDVVYASVLAQGETPVVILMSGVILGEKLDLGQWVGVIVALIGAAYLSAWLAKEKK